MAASIMQVARTLGQISDWSLSNLEMQKIGFIAEMLHLGRTAAPLIVEDWQAWDYGPVQPSLYHQAKIFGAEDVRDIFFASLLPAGSSQEKAVKDAYSAMKNLKPGQMVNITHQPNGAWAKHYVPGQRGRVIPKAAIKAEYGALIQNDD